MDQSCIAASNRSSSGAGPRWEMYRRVMRHKALHGRLVTKVNVDHDAGREFVERFDSGACRGRKHIDI